MTLRTAFKFILSTIMYVLIGFVALIAIGILYIVSIVAWHHVSPNANSAAVDQNIADANLVMNSMFHHPSFETTPVIITYGKNRYVIPRNYIVQEDNWSNPSSGGITLSMTFPGFKPLTHDNKDCFLNAPAYWPKGCVPMEVRLTESIDVSEDEGFKNFSDLFRSQIPQKGPYGYELYEVGREGVIPFQFFRKYVNGHHLVFDCYGTMEAIKLHLMKSFLCTTFSRLPNQNGIQYLINRWPGYTGDQLEFGDQIDAGIRNTILSFATEGAKP